MGDNKDKPDVNPDHVAVIANDPITMKAWRTSKHVFGNHQSKDYDNNNNNPNAHPLSKFLKFLTIGVKKMK